MQDLWDYLAGGESLDSFLDSFPTVPREQAVRAISVAGERLLEGLPRSRSVGGRITLSSLPKPYYTPEQYLERDAECKSEYFSGQIFALAGGSPRHNAITVNVSSELRFQFRGRPCQAFASDLRVRVMAPGLYACPDVAAVCGGQEFDPLDVNTLINPQVIVEVLSRSTEAYDRGEKFAHYRRIASLTDYVLISQDRVYVEHFVRQPDGRWLLTELNDLQDRILLPAVGCELALAEVYDKINFGLPDAETS